MDRMFIGMILTLAINDQGQMLIGQFLNLMTLAVGTEHFFRRFKSIGVAPFLQAEKRN